MIDPITRKVTLSGISPFTSFDWTDSKETKSGDRGGLFLAEDDGWFYGCGSNHTWDRINVDTLKVEPLAALLPYPKLTNQCAVSTFHGLVRFSPHSSTDVSSSYPDMAELEAAIPNLFQVTLKDKPSDK